jgi:hypothetical protein
MRAVPGLVVPFRVGPRHVCVAPVSTIARFARFAI